MLKKWRAQEEFYKGLLEFHISETKLSQNCNK